MGSSQFRSEHGRRPALSSKCNPFQYIKVEVFGIPAE
jgi:hypothetical protein